MQRYFVSPGNIREREIWFEGDDARHITRVMRMREGDEVIACDGLGQSWLVRLAEWQADRVVGTILRRMDESVEPAVKLTLVQSLPKGDKMDLIVQKGTEVGISVFQPLVTARTIVEYDEKKEAKRRERWQRIVKEAAEQAHRARIPEIRTSQSFDVWLSSLDGFDLVLMPYEREERQGIREVLARFPQAGSIAIVIGPEGGFDREEVERAKAFGVETVSLGPRILRTETAGLVTATAILYHYGELGGGKR
jgi:16S rRNA (uracil1498-N3)-methyltransferase